MKNIFLTLNISLICLFLPAISGFAQSPAPTSPDSIPPVMLVKPLLINVEHPDSRFIEREVKVFNRGGGSLRILSIAASCGCSSGKTLQSEIHPLEAGRIMLSVNLDGMYEDKNEVEFIIESNAKNSPVIVKIAIKDYEKKTDSNPKNE